MRNSYQGKISKLLLTAALAPIIYLGSIFCNNEFYNMASRDLRLEASKPITQERRADLLSLADKFEKKGYLNVPTTEIPNIRAFIPFEPVISGEVLRFTRAMDFPAPVNTRM